jgi:cyanate lyase
LPSESDTALSSESRKSSFTILSWFQSALQVREAKSHSSINRASGIAAALSFLALATSPWQTLSMTREEVTSAIRAAKAAKKLTWQEIAKQVGKSSVWTTSVCLGQNSMSAEQADRLVDFLELPSEASVILQQFPTKGNVLDVPQDPLLYRFHEINLVYGQTIKELIHEQFGDGIMSAIDFTMEIEKVADPKGDRVKVTMCGKFLPYKTW